MYIAVFVPTIYMNYVKDYDVPYYLIIFALIPPALNLWVYWLSFLFNN